METGVMVQFLFHRAEQLGGKSLDGGPTKINGDLVPVKSGDTSKLEGNIFTIMREGGNRVSVKNHRGEGVDPAHCVHA